RDLDHDGARSRPERGHASGFAVHTSVDGHGVVVPMVLPHDRSHAHPGFALVCAARSDRGRSAVRHWTRIHFDSAGGHLAYAQVKRKRAAASTNGTPAKTYDQHYFDRWYRASSHAYLHLDMLPRRVQLAVSAAEYLLERPIRSVLDVGCGEGRWRALLLKARPKLYYPGVDASEYAIRRYGRRRNLRLGRFGDLGRLRLKRRFDLIVCSDVLHYVTAAEARKGLKALTRLLHGIAFMELFTADDDTV